MKNLLRTRKEVLTRRGIKALFAIIFLILVELIYPEKNAREFHFKIGDISPKDIISPLAFDIPKPEEEIEKESFIAQSLVPPYLEPVLGFSPFPEDVSFSGHENIPKYEIEKMLSHLRKFLNSIYKNIIIKDKDSLPLMGGKYVVLIEGERERKISIEEVFDIEEIRASLLREAERVYKKDSPLASLFFEIGTIFLKPNWVFNKQRTNEERKLAKESIPRTMGKVLKGEKIIGAHERIGEEVLLKLKALEKNLKKEKIGSLGIPLSALRFFIFFLFLTLGYLGIRFFHREIYEDPNKFLANFINLFILLIVQSFLFRMNLDFYFVPFPFMSITTFLLTDASFAFFLTFIGALFAGAFSNFQFHSFIFYIFVGTLGVFLARTFRNRFHLYIAIVFLFLFGSFLTVILFSFQALPISIGDIFLGNLLSSSGSVVLVLILLPFYERFLKMTTDYILLELSDLSHPVLMEMQRKIPGSFHHSITLGNLAETGARAIGANSLLVRVGAYYHDIGKLKNPEYFGENQKGINPHDELSPKISALILRNHVQYGVELAKRYNLPNAIVDMIKTHHGTTLMIPFYERAKKANPLVEEADFRYFGPKPRKREEAILMLADTVEATVRSIENLNPARLKEIIDEAIERRFRDGQFDNCPITRLDLERIKEAFYPALIYSLHARPEYPRIDEKNKS